MDRYILIVEANSTKGNELMKRLIAENYMVIATDKNYETKKFGNLIYLNMDLDNPKSIMQAKNIILKYTSSLYAIINLANYVTFDSLLEGEEDDFRRSLEINFFGVYRAIKILWTLLGQNHCRIINDCSDVSLFSPAPFNGLYALSKTMLSLYSDVLRRELAFKNIKVIKVHSGYIKDQDHEAIIEDYHNKMEASDDFHTEMARFKELNLNNQSQVDINLYLDLMVSILKKNNPKPVYILKPNKNLKLISHLTLSKQDKVYLKLRK